MLTHRIRYLIAYSIIPACGILFWTSTSVEADDKPASETSAGWVKYAKNPVLGGDLGTCFDISVLKEGDTYRMWFSWRPKKSIALVESKDGIEWTKPVIVLGPNDKTDWENDLNRPSSSRTATAIRCGTRGRHGASRGLAMPPARTGRRGNVRATSRFSQRKSRGRRSP